MNTKGKGMMKILWVVLSSAILVASAVGASQQVERRTTTTTAGGATVAATAATAEMAAKLQQPITVQFQEAKFCDVVTFLHDKCDVNIIVMQEPAATVTLMLKNLPLSQVIRYLAELTGQEVAVEKDTVVFRPKSTAASAGTGGDQYKLESSVEAAQAPHQYTVAVKIHKSPDGKNWDVLSAPRVTTRAGQEAKIEVKDEKTGNGVECTVLVTEVAAGTVEMSVACKVQEAGRAPWQSELKTRIKLP